MKERPHEGERRQDPEISDIIKIMWSACDFLDNILGHVKWHFRFVFSISPPRTYVYVRYKLEIIILFYIYHLINADLSVLFIFIFYFFNND